MTIVLNDDGKIRCDGEAIGGPIGGIRARHGGSAGVNVQVAITIEKSCAAIKDLIAVSVSFAGGDVSSAPEAFPVRMNDEAGAPTAPVTVIPMHIVDGRLGSGDGNRAARSLAIGLRGLVAQWYHRPS